MADAKKRNLAAESKECAVNLGKLVDEAYKQGKVSRFQDQNEIVITIRIPHIKDEGPERDLFIFAADSAV